MLLAIIKSNFYNSTSWNSLWQKHKSVSSIINNFVLICC